MTKRRVRQATFHPPLIIPAAWREKALFLASKVKGNSGGNENSGNNGGGTNNSNGNTSEHGNGQGNGNQGKPDSTGSSNANKDQMDKGKGKGKGKSDNGNGKGYGPDKDKKGKPWKDFYSPLTGEELALVSEQPDYLINPVKSVEYQYDAVGNRISMIADGQQTAIRTMKLIG